MEIYKKRIIKKINVDCCSKFIRFFDFSNWLTTQNRERKTKKLIIDIFYKTLDEIVYFLKVPLNSKESVKCQVYTGYKKHPYII